jgi:hypothetical protein
MTEKPEEIKSQSSDDISDISDEEIKEFLDVLFENKWFKRLILFFVIFFFTRSAELAIFIVIFYTILTELILKTDTILELSDF